VLTVGANILLAAGVVAAAMLWGYALWWLLTAISSILHTVAQGIPFNLGWWGSGTPVPHGKAKGCTQAWE
jgi:tellurite resistance protein TehA-like permease